MKNALGIASALTYLILAIVHKERTDFWLYFWCMAVLFAFYYYVNIYTKFSLRQSLFWSGCFNVIFIFYLPVLSDDVYRFIWDGFLTLSGHNPYKSIPVNYNGPMINGLLEKLNSPNYYSLYPPLKQYLFVSASWLGQGSVFGFIISMRIFLILSNLISTYIVYFIAAKHKYTKERAYQTASFFALNPFVILETSGNFHFEGVMLMFLLLGYYVYIKYGNVIVSAFLFGMAVSIKLMPLIFLPLIWFRLGFRKGLYFVLISSALNLLLFAPFYEFEMVLNVLNSLDLYFHNFEFNASVYYVLRELGIIITGYNLISFLGTGLAFLSLSIILRLSFNVEGIAKASLYVCLVYLLCSTTIHPWYILPLFGISLFTPFRFPLIWTFLISISYYAYIQIPPLENLYLIFLEYFIVLSIFYFESRNKRPIF
jgi:alpha-1,6-mannosyltransferase